MKNPFGSPAAVQRGKKKQESPLGACAKIKNASHIGAEQNHLCPVIKYSREFPIFSARLVFARTSDPPCFSVIPIPTRIPVFSLAGRNRGSYSAATICASHTRAKSASPRSAATEENVIEIGHVCPNSF